MSYTITILEDGPLLHLLRGDVIVIDPEAPQPVMLCRPLPINYAAIVPVLIDQGAAESTLSVAEISALANLFALPSQPSQQRPAGARGVRRLRLEA